MKKIKKVKKVKNKKRNYKLIVRAAFLILALLFATGLYQVYKYVPGVKEAVTLATTIKPETFTELYFEDHSNLSGEIAYNNRYDFQFTIHNLEDKNMEYPYEVYIEANGEKQVVDKRIISIPKDKHKTIPENFIYNSSAARIKVIVSLTDKKQQIYLFANIINPAHKTITTVPISAPIFIPEMKYGGWYWRPELGRAQVWLGYLEGVDKWSDTFPTKEEQSQYKSVVQSFKRYGGWYWRPELGRPQVWFGISNGKDKWSDTFPERKKK